MVLTVDDSFERFLSSYYGLPSVEGLIVIR
jgi:hypothetical protein